MSVRKSPTPARDAAQELATGACRVCGGDRKHVAVNPAWMVARRKDAGWTLSDVAKALGFSVPYLCDIEHGRRAVSRAIYVFYRDQLAE